MSFEEHGPKTYARCRAAGREYPSEVFRVTETALWLWLSDCSLYGGTMLSLIREAWATSAPIVSAAPP